MSMPKPFLTALVIYYDPFSEEDTSAIITRVHTDPKHDLLVDLTCFPGGEQCVVSSDKYRVHSGEEDEGDVAVARARGGMKLKMRFEKNDTNHHGTQAKGEPWNKQTVHGWKLHCVDLLQPIKQREKSNPEGGKTRAKWYKRFILYLPSGAWWNLDVALVSW